MVLTVPTHIHLDDRGVAWIDDTQVKVIEVAADWKAYGWTAQETHEQHPHLSMAQIHAALSYYYDHQEALDAELEQQAQRLDAWMNEQRQAESSLRQRLKAEGKLT